MLEISREISSHFAEIVVRDSEGPSDKLRPALSPASIPPTDTLSASAHRSSALTALSHPLPAGMRDFLPDEARSQGELVGKTLTTFELFGFQQVSLPAFEYAEVLERGLGPVEAAMMLRFVEPETGEVVALRPDMTPQVARLVATRLPDGPFPARFCYRGSVLRRRHERARHDQQLLQTGIELVGAGGLSADLEVIEATTRAVRDAGLSDFVLDLGHGGIATSLLADVDDDVKPRLVEALSLKDQAELVKRAERAGLDSALTKRLAELLELHGGVEVFERARRSLAGTPALVAIEELAALHAALEESAVAPGIVVDLGETRSFAYYTGPMFQVLAEGPGQAVASGGRYDALLAAFTRSLPAAGAVIQIDHLAWALGGNASTRQLRALVVPGENAPAAGSTEAARVARRLREVALALRMAKIPSAVADSADALDYARAWRYSHVVRLSEGDTVRLSSLGGVSDTGSEAETGSPGDLSLDAVIERMRA